ncbi:CLK4-associating serine/arginine rich protein [Elysia marginata]|uniref:CLK4-associating serine/arginine rich protein n=1 Tax=Elysia marginata TaxID=1093978 RepID=A0AAV4I2E2_9GAST|nr:CLK4-associating serine/arginine rich protein [Elysia marginata]
MWHEARRQERKIRGIMVDFKRRADRRREFYEKIKQDPTQFLRMYGRPVKIHLDPAVAMAAEGPQSMMPWQGDATNMIDRFDVRANLDLIPPYVPDRSNLSDALDEEERFGNYERYRTLVENEAAGCKEN